MVVGVEVLGRLAASPFDFGLADRRLDRAYDAFGDLVLQVENVLDGAVELVRPEMAAAQASINWPVMRSRFPDLRTLPSKT